MKAGPPSGAGPGGAAFGAASELDGLRLLRAIDRLEEAMTTAQEIEAALGALDGDAERMAAMNRDLIRRLGEAHDALVLLLGSLERSRLRGQPRRR